MPHEVELRCPVFRGLAYRVDEAKQLGLIDRLDPNNKRKVIYGTHAQVTSGFTRNEGHLLAEFVKSAPDSLLVDNGKGIIRVFRPRSRVKEVTPEAEE